MGLQVAAGVRDEQWTKIFRVFTGWIEPGRLAWGIEDDGHAVVDRGGEVVGLGGDDGTGPYNLFFVRDPLLPESSYGDDSVVAPVQIMGDLAVGSLLPLVIAAGRDEAAPTFECGSEGWFFVDGFGAGIDHAVADFGIFGPEGY